MPGNPRLALIQQERELSHGQFHAAQERENPQPRRVGKGLQTVGERQRIHLGKVI